jgi:hypothetical protein
MKKLMTCLAVGTFATFLGVASTPAYAQTDKEYSSFTVTEPLEVGAYTLPPGTYLVKVVLLQSNRNMIQVSNVEQTKVFATVLARPHPILPEEVIPSSRFVYYATASGQPKALKTWFAGDTYSGQDIIYPKQRAMELAAASKEPVIAIPDEVKEAEFKTVPLTIVTPERQVKPYEEPVIVARKAPEPAPIAVAEARPSELPKTASHVPLFAALGVLSLGGALGLRALTNRAL